MTHDRPIDFKVMPPRQGRLSLLGLLLLLITTGLNAQETNAEAQAFAIAARAFQDGVFDRAEKEFAAFTTTFPQSPRLPEAILFQSRAALELKQLSQALALLSTHLKNAGPLTDQYRYWQGEAYLKGSQYQEAADSFTLLAQEHPDSVLLLEAGYWEALARFKMGDYRTVINALQQPEGAFQKAAKVRANHELVARGHLLLAEALVQIQEYTAAEQAVQRLNESPLLPEFAWRRQYLLCRIQLADKRPQQSLNNTTNLLSLAAKTSQPGLLAESVALQADILHRLNQLPASIQVYAQNLGEGVPPEYRRQALVRTIELNLEQKNIEQAARLLQEFLGPQAKEDAADLALLTLGEVHLKLHVTGAAIPQNHTNSPLAVTNHLSAALTQFNTLVTRFTNSSFLGKAHLNRGWSLWLEGKTAESGAAFKLAADQLPLSEDLAIARFKLADVQFQLNDLTNALANYQSVVKEFEAFPRVRNTLFDHALYQILRVSLQLNDLASASSAMKQILEWFPDSDYRDTSMLLVGQSLNQSSQSEAARQLFAGLVKRIPDSPLKPEVELAVARTYVQEKDWTNAIQHYTHWLTLYPANALRPQAEFNQAWSTSQAGQETNALALFTNFVARFPTNELALLAQYWVASYYYNQTDFVNAEMNFQHDVLLKNPTYTQFAYRARMMAGRAAYARQSWKDARDYFSALVSDINCPPELVAEGLFALGDTLIQEEEDAANPLKKFVLATEAFSKIQQLYPTNRLVPQAWGRIGDCHLQMGAADAKQYENATNAYAKVLAHKLANASTRSQAEIGIGIALERVAQPKGSPDRENLLKLAFDRYYNIVIEKNLRPGESPDPFWFKEACLNATRLAEQSGQWEVAINIYDRLASALPHLRPAIQKKIAELRKQAMVQKT